MKTHLKRSYDKPSSSVFRSSINVLSEYPSRYSPRPRIVQPSTSEQQRLLSSLTSSRLQHVHWGKYGIKPLWPSDKYSCEQWEHKNKQTITQYLLSFFSSTPKHDRNRCLGVNSNSERKYFHVSTSFIPWINQADGSTLIVLSVSLILLLLFLLLLVYTVYRRQQTKQIEARINEERRRTNVEDSLRSHSTIEDYLSAVRTLPSIVEETSVTSSLPPLIPSAQFNLSPSFTNNHFESPDNDNLSLKSVEHSETQSKTTESSTLVGSAPIKDEPSTLRRRRSRFDQNSTPTSNDSASAEDPLVPPVIVRKLSTAHQRVIADEFTSLEQIDQAVKDVGLVRSQLIFGIDYTISNLETGKHSFNGLSLHHIQDGLLNPYQNVITIVGRTLEKFDSDTLIPVFGFGDRATLDRKIFPLRPNGSYCKGFRGVLEAYNEVTPKVRMSGPTNFAPLIREAIRIVKKTRQYHILVIVADGQVTNERQTKDAIVEASSYPLSIVMIGVGDGPWDMMNEFDDSLPTRQFDNFQFVNYNSIVQASNNNDSTFALHALMEIPSQYAAIKELGLLQEN